MFTLYFSFHLVLILLIFLIFFIVFNLTLKLKIYCYPLIYIFILILTLILLIVIFYLFLCIFFRFHPSIFHFLRIEFHYFSCIVLLVWWLDSWVWKANGDWFFFCFIFFSDINVRQCFFFFHILFYNWFLMVSYIYRVISISSARLQVSRVTQLFPG